MLMNQVIIGIGYIKHHVLMKELWLLMLGPKEFFLPPDLQDFPVGIGVFGEDKRRAGCGPVLGHEPARLVPHTASVAERFRAHGPGSPLRRLVRVAVETPPALAVVAQGGGGGPATGGAFLLFHCRFHPLSGVVQGNVGL